MKIPAIPDNEAERLEILCAINVLNSPAEERFDRITRVAAALFDVPIALVSLIDEQRQWFKSRFGLEVAETAREVSFCGHAILGDEILIVPDAQKDERFADNPAVTGEPFVRFYAGHPVRGPGGVKLGTLCIVDTRPREFSDTDKERLRDLARMVEGELDKSALAAATRERKLQLSAAQQRLELHVDHSPLAVVEWDPAVRVSRWSEHSEEVLGWPAEEVLGRHPHDWGFVHEADRTVFGHAMARLRGHLEPRNAFHMRSRRKDGRVAVCAWHNSAVFDEEGRLTSILSLVQDITAQQEAEAALKQSEEQFRATFEQAPVGIAHVALDGSWLKVNRPLYDMLGYTREELQQLTFQDVTHPDDLAADLAELEKLLAGGIPSYSLEKRYIRKSGWVVWAHLTVSVYRDAAGHPLHLIAVIEDIEARKAAEQVMEGIRQNLEQLVEERTEALRLSNEKLAVEVEQRRQAEADIAASEERLREIVENSHEAFVGIDEQGLICDWNRQAEELFGWKRVEVLGRLLTETIIPHEFRQGHNHGMARFLASGEGPVLNKRVELPALRRSGERFLVEMTIGVSRVLGCYHFGAFLHDISERKRIARELESKQELLDAVLDTIDAGVVACDEQARLTVFNRATRDWHGLPANQLPSEEWAQHYDLYTADESRLLRQDEVPLYRALQGEVVNDLEITIVPKNAPKRHLSCSGRALVNARGEKLGAVVAMYDITERLRAERALRESQERLKTITDNMPALIAYVDAEQRYRFNNRTYESWFGVPVEQLYGKTLREVVGEADYAAMQRYVEGALAGQNVTFEKRSGSGPEARYSEATFIPHRDDDGQADGFYVMVRDVTERKRMELSMEHMARHDALTGQLNRRGLIDVLQAAISRAQRHGRALALMFLDVDHFKQINDRYGHESGDLLLIEFGRRLAASVRKSDTIGRLAGDEFVVLLEVFSGKPEDASSFARKILRAMAEPMELRGDSVPLSTSIGVVISAAPPDETPSALLDRADAAMYVAKQQGRSRFHLAGPAAPEGI